MKNGKLKYKDFGPNGQIRDIKLDISNENPGVYFVKLAGEFGTTIKRIILQQ